MHNSAPLKKTEFQHSSNLSKIFSSSQNTFQNNSQDIWIANEILLNVFAFLQPDSGANTQMKTWNVHPALRLRIADLVWITFPRQNRTHRHPSEPYGFPSFTGALVSLLPLFWLCSRLPDYYRFDEHPQCLQPTAQFPRQWWQTGMYSYEFSPFYVHHLTHNSRRSNGGFVHSRLHEANIGLEPNIGTKIYSRCWRLWTCPFALPQSTIFLLSISRESLLINVRPEASSLLIFRMDHRYSRRIFRNPGYDGHRIYIHGDGAVECCQ